MNARIRLNFDQGPVVLDTLDKIGYYSANLHQARSNWMGSDFKPRNSALFHSRP